VSTVRTAPGMNLPHLHRKARQALIENLSSDEFVAVCILGPSDQAIFGTQRRAFIFKKGFLAGASFGAEMTSWDYRSLVGVQLHTGMMSGAVILQGPGQSGTKTSYWSNGDSDPYKAPNAIPVVRPFPPVARAVAELRRLMDAAQNSKTGDQLSSSVTPASFVDELTKLAQLVASGALSSSEFDVAKARLLGM